LKIFVNNLPFTVTEGELLGLFQPFGEIESVKLVLNNHTGVCKGYGFVKMPQAEQAEAAIAALDEQLFKGRSLSVMPAQLGAKKAKAQRKLDQAQSARPAAAPRQRPAGFKPAGLPGDRPYGARPFSTAKPAGFKRADTPGRFQRDDRRPGFPHRDQPGGFQRDRRPAGSTSSDRPGSADRPHGARPFSAGKPAGFRRADTPGGFKRDDRRPGFPHRAQPAGFQRDRRPARPASPVRSGDRMDHARPSRRPIGKPRRPR